MSESPIPFVDMAATVRALRPQIDAALARVLDSGWFVLGPENEAFEAELAAAFGVRDAVAVANGTEALQLALEVLGIGPGDEVVTSPISAAFTALAIQRCGARPVFADVEPDTLNLSPAAAARAVSERTRALLPVHLYGHPAEIETFVALAAERGLHLVEDACQSHGASVGGRPVGGFGALAALSFYPTKNLGGLGDGGAILVGDPERALRLRRLRNGGQSDRYRHEEPGLNSRLDELQAAVLRVKLARLDAGNRRRRELAALYRRELEGAAVALPAERDGVSAVYHLFVIRHPRRDALMARLKERGIGTLIHYPTPLHLQPVFAGLGCRPGELPVAERAAGEILSLPLQPELDDATVLRVARAVRECAESLA